ncbi:metal-sulfur cluster assembly factor [Herbiconiux ginsengi]|uniref:Metal-sulfur cluster biosynthetic enzyme n=1 Tax=Herbiconiux ginsengi TaxID=381665 RepID=A0A1H3JGZ2_9MICO|nr:iron-sulfur cluster assembly protein [Herbiconiux ginsengi]SDY39137.1 Metal-sulfur cluster biosynthetic enzyme [Herbiconiux ginsengi]
MTALAPTEHGALLALTENDVLRALDAVIDPELDEPITDLGFVRSVRFTDDGIEVHLRLPTSFCAPNFAYLMASDAKDVLTALPEAGTVVVELDDHHDSDIINRGLAADAGYRGTFRHEAESDLDELRAVFQRKAHTAAMERALTALLRARDDLGEQDVAQVVLGDLPDDEAKTALLRRRETLGLSLSGSAPVLVDDRGDPYPAASAALALRRARSTRISIDGNAHFCRGLLATRYPGAEADQAPRADENFFPTSSLLRNTRKSVA